MSVLVRTRTQLNAAAAIFALDGVARRMILCTPDLPESKLPLVASASDADVVLVDDPSVAAQNLELPCILFPVPGGYREIASAVTEDASPPAELQTEWVLMTSGTTGTPKLVAHTLATLVGDWAHQTAATSGAWSTFYDIRRYGGLQIFLRAAFGGASLVLSDPGETIADFVSRAVAHGVSHLSGTPSHWRRALMFPRIADLPLQYVRLSGEVADQAILDQLRAQWPEARIVHAFASTEAGLAFEVSDGRAGVPASVIEAGSGVEVRLDGGMLCVRSPRNAIRYVGKNVQPLKRADGFVNTGDVLQRAGDRFVYAGRMDGVINVGGLKVAPEEVEAVLNSHPGVRAALVRPKRSAVTGQLVVAEVVPRGGSTATQPTQLTTALLRHCREVLDAYKVPAAITLVDSLPISETGKLVRAHA